MSPPISKALKVSDAGNPAVKVRRAEIAQARVRLGFDVLGEGCREPRLADARLAGD
jgi:hypothetical protein